MAWCTRLRLISLLRTLKRQIICRSIASNSIAATDFDVYPQPPPDASICRRRAPIVTIMGHVNHGKTTLLDALRKSQITATEFGGITQHIGAFSVQLPNVDARVTFLDTPGHAAFATMRERGAHATDIIVLVVAANDGVMDQTIESIRYAQTFNVPIVVAINKCDHPNAEPEKVKRALLEHDIVVEDYSGDVQSVEISALKGINLLALQESLIAQAELMNLTATSKGLVEAIVIESTLVVGIGKTCTLIVQRGTLQKGRLLVAGTAWCKVRTMVDERGRTMTEAGPSTPVRVSGWRNELPPLGETALEVESEHIAQKVVALRHQKKMAKKAENDMVAIQSIREADRAEYRQKLAERIASGKRTGIVSYSYTSRQQTIESNLPELAILLKADVEGSVDAIMQVIETYSSDDQCHLHVVDFGVGSPTIGDLQLAIDAKACIYCFNVTVPTNIQESATSNSIEIVNYNVIYHLVDHLRNALTERLPYISEPKTIGEGSVIASFIIRESNKKVPIAGCLVHWGTFERNARIRFLRGNTIYYDGEIEALKVDKEFVKSAKINQEVGIRLPLVQKSDDPINFEIGDRVQVYRLEDVKQEIRWHPPGF